MIRWEIVEEETYQRCVAQLGGARGVDRALAPLVNGLSLNPRGFPLAGYKDYRLARTRIIMRDGEIIPAMSLRFAIDPPSTVRLLHVEIAMPEEMEDSDVWPWL